MGCCSIKTSVRVTSGVVLRTDWVDLNALVASQLRETARVLGSQGVPADPSIDSASLYLGNIEWFSLIFQGFRDFPWVEVGAVSILGPAGVPCEPGTRAVSRSWEATRAFRTIQSVRRTAPEVTRTPILMLRHSDSMSSSSKSKKSRNPWKINENHSIFPG